MTQLKLRQMPLEERTDSPGRTAARMVAAASGGWKVALVKILALAIVDAIALYAVLVLASVGDWVVVGVIVIVTAAVNVIYFRRGRLPAKYLAPGLIFLAIFQIFVVLYSGYVAFTNYGTGHNSTKEDAIQALILQSQQRVEDSPGYPVTVLENFGEIGLLLTTPEGDALLGRDGEVAEEVDARIEGGRAVALDGWNSLDFAGVVANQNRVTQMTVLLSEGGEDGSLRTQDGNTAYLYTSRFIYEPDRDVMVDTASGETFSDVGTGAFTSEAGEELMPGWKVDVGFANFERAFGEPTIREPLLAVTVWTFAFALISVASTFLLGLVLALVFNDPRMRSRSYYRVVMILPYAFPGFLSALVWSGLLNQEFGFINVVFLGGAEVPWLTNEWLAKFSILFVNLWLGFPYMFLVTTGALQSIPGELTEAAQMDGATPFQAFRLIKMPLLLVSVAPLLISSFAFNFNNFNLIYMLTRGGPRDITADVNVGATDILISMVYKVAFVGSDRDYGLASAFAIIIFVIVGTISVIAFRRTKTLEELN
ncbi:ABC transporter permease subunit [Salinibacterium sp. ZJ70]|uniref:ABC transporter permease subunit n=1 Tax=Salinibacterium sp. ZJ70 TaxID=2708084 RepID=UPI001CD2B792|nr:ABC transporter permease subunit [Salinibacterium sp. ZJ70]